MQLEKIISISGKPGLYQLVTQLRNGFIIEDITTKKKVSISNSSQVSLLDNIAMYSINKEVPLFDVFEEIAKEYKYGPTISHKSSDEELIALLEKALPDYDREKVYTSDIKKLVQWYNILQKAGYITETSFVSKVVPPQPEPKSAVEEKKTEKKPATTKAKTTKTAKAKEEKTTAAKKTTKAAKTTAKETKSSTTKTTKTSAKTATKTTAKTTAKSAAKPKTTTKKK